MPPVTPYSKFLGDREPVAALRQTASLIVALTSCWLPADFERSHSSGKWSARKVLLHLAHIEIAFGMRVRMALTTKAYAVQPFDQDLWMERESIVAGRSSADV